MNTNVSTKNSKKRRTVQYDRWGYFFIAPFFLVYLDFSLIPLLTTFVYSFFENYKIGLDVVGPNASVYKYFKGLEEDYEWELEDTPAALDEFITKYENNTLTIDIKKDILEAIEKVDGTIDLDLYAKDLDKLIRKDISKGKSSAELIEDAKIVNDSIFTVSKSKEEIPILIKKYVP